MNKIILVFYINIGNRSSLEARMYIRKMAENISGENKDDESILRYYVPTIDRDTEIVCLNPVLMTDAQYTDVKSVLDDVKIKLEEFLKTDTDK